MKDLIRVKVIETTQHKPPATDTPILTLKLEPLVTGAIVLPNGQEVEYLFTTVTDSDGSTPGGWRQAQLRYVLGLTPHYLASKELTVPKFTKTEVRDILGKTFVVAIDLESVPMHGERVHVLDFYRDGEVAVSPRKDR